MNETSIRLFDAISRQAVDEVEKLLAASADPNARDEYGETALMKACDSWHLPENRFTMVKALLAAGADPNKLGDDGVGPLFSCVIAQDARLIEFLLEQGADPNKEECNAGESLYDWAEFDYRFEEYDLDLPEEPSGDDIANADCWLNFLRCLAVKYGKNPPDCPSVLRRGHATFRL